MIVVAGRSARDELGRLWGSCCARVADTPWGDVAMVASCGNLYGRHDKGLASSTYVMRLSQWFEEELPTLLSATSAERRSILDMVQREWEGLHASLLRLFWEYGRETGRPIGCSVASVLAFESLYITMRSSGAAVHCLEGSGSSDGYSTTYGGGAASLPTPEDAPRFDRGILGKGDVLVSTTRPLDMRAMCQGLSDLSSGEGREGSARRVGSWLDRQVQSGTSVSCLEYC